MQECIDAGINVKVVTGDTSGTAREIARQIGLRDDSRKHSIIAPDFAAPPDEELQHVSTN